MKSMKVEAVAFTFFLNVLAILPGLSDGGGNSDSVIIIGGGGQKTERSSSVRQVGVRINEDDEIKMDYPHQFNQKKVVSPVGSEGHILDVKGRCWVVTLNDVFGKALLCNGTNNLTITLSHLQPQLVATIKSIDIFHSSIPILNLSDFSSFALLENISVTESSVSSIIGWGHMHLRSLNLSSNHLKFIDNSIFQTAPNTFTTTSSPLDYNYNYSSEDITAKDDEGQKGGGGMPLSQLQVIDLSHNMITELPKSVFHLKGLKTLRLAGNQFKCEFVWDKLWEWYVISDPDILIDADETFCGVKEEVFHYTVLGVLKAHKDLEETCGSVNKSLCRDCSLYALQREGHPISHKSSHGTVSISLKLDCSGRNLTQLPTVPYQTWQLNISNNQIKDLSPLKEEMYSNLRILDGDNNQINLETLVATDFIHKYYYLSLQNNQFSTIPTQILSSFKSMSGPGVTFFGGNFIDCDCDAVKEVKPLLIENSKKIQDMKDIYCKEMTNGDSSAYIRVKDLQYSDVCYMESSDSTHEIYLYLIIVMEVTLIVLIIAKVWHDRRTFRQTGILPWCSSKMPRLPCDAMLESVKEPPNNSNNRRSTVAGVGSAASSSTNVNHHSIISHIQLKDVRSSSSAHSDKSSSQQSQFSTFPSSSSRTSPV